MSWTGEWAGFGVGSLDEDVAEMSELIRHIRKTDGTSARSLAPIIIVKEAGRRSYQASKTS